MHGRMASRLTARELLSNGGGGGKKLPILRVHLRLFRLQRDSVCIFLHVIITEWGLVDNNRNNYSTNKSKNINILNHGASSNNRR